MLDPVAIIGIGYRFPAARDRESLWRLFRDGVDAITEVPTDRWDVDYFDARFFGIAPYQIEQIDPQQRLVLENFGITPEKLSGSQTSVFTGISHSHYDRLIYQNPYRIRGHSGPGAYHSIAAMVLKGLWHAHLGQMMTDDMPNCTLSARDVYHDTVLKKSMILTVPRSSWGCSFRPPLGP